MSRFQEIVERVLAHEGGYANRGSADKGGETNLGITWPTLEEALRLGVVASGTTIKTLNAGQARVIYDKLYWQRIGGDALPAGLDEFLFDYGVNSGTGRAAKALQRALGVLPDGVIGPRTLAALAKADPEAVLRLVFVDRAILFAEDSTWQANKRGWMARLFDKTATALRAMAL